MHDFKEFSTKERWNKIRKFKFKDSFGLRDGFTFYRATRPKEKKFVLTAKQYSDIISQVNLGIGDKLLEGFVIKLPSYVGELYIQKRTVEPFINKEGHLVFNSPVDWKKTLQLWFNSEEAHNNKSIVKSETRTAYSIHYNKRRARFTNQGYVGFRAQRSLKLKLSSLAQLGKIEGYLKPIK